MYKRGSSREREMGKTVKKGRLCRSQKNGPPSAQDISENIMKAVFILAIMNLLNE